EIASYKIFAAIKNNLPAAQISYSEFCTASNQTRYFDVVRVQKQRYSILKPHKVEKYITSYKYEEIRDANGKTDWIISLTPGPRALVEFRTYNQRQDEAAGARRPSAGPAGLTDPTAREWFVRELCERGVTARG